MAPYSTQIRHQISDYKAGDTIYSLLAKTRALDEKILNIYRELRVGPTSLYQIVQQVYDRASIGWHDNARLPDPERVEDPETAPKFKHPPRYVSWGEYREITDFKDSANAQIATLEKKVQVLIEKENARTKAEKLSKHSQKPPSEAPKPLSEEQQKQQLLLDDRVKAVEQQVRAQSKMAGELQKNVEEGLADLETNFAMLETANEAKMESVAKTSVINKYTDLHLAAQPTATKISSWPAPNKSYSRRAPVRVDEDRKVPEVAPIMTHTRVIRQIRETIVELSKVVVVQQKQSSFLNTPLVPVHISEEKLQKAWRDLKHKDPNAEEWVTGERLVLECLSNPQAAKRIEVFTQTRPEPKALIGYAGALSSVPVHFQKPTLGGPVPQFVTPGNQPSAKAAPAALPSSGPRTPLIIQGMGDENEQKRMIHEQLAPKVVERVGPKLADEIILRLLKLDTALLLRMLDVPQEFEAQINKVLDTIKAQTQSVKVAPTSKPSKHKYSGPKTLYVNDNDAVFGVHTSYSKLKYVKFVAKIIIKCRYRIEMDTERDALLADIDLSTDERDLRNIAEKYFLTIPHASRTFLSSLVVLDAFKHISNITETGTELEKFDTDEFDALFESPRDWDSIGLECEEVLWAMKGSSAQ